MKKLLATAVGVVSVCLAASAEDIQLKGGEGTPGGITDEGGKVNVTKTGAGTHWLGGDLTFSGKLTAQQGNLTIGSGKPYSWFRLSFVELKGKVTNLRIRQIGLYDKDGVRQNSDMIADVPDLSGYNKASDDCKYYTIGKVTGSGLSDTLQPNHAAYDKSMKGLSIAIYQDSTYGSSDLQNCFDETNGYNTSHYYKAKIYRASVGASVPPLPEAPTNWIKVVMRLKENANPIHHFDVQMVETNGALAPVRMLLEGSADGLCWDTVYSNARTNDAPYVLDQTNTLYNCWVSSPDVQANNGSHARPAGTGFNLSASGLVSHPVGLSSAKWWRISFTENKETPTMRFGQIGLYDKDGNRQNGNLTADVPELSLPTSATWSAYYTIGKNKGSGTSKNLASGHLAYDASMFGRVIGVWNNPDNSYGDIDSCCNSSAGSTTYIKLMNKENGTYSINADPTDPDTWIKVVMHLNDDANPIHHFDMEVVGGANSKNAATRLRLEASLDGETWYTTWDNTEGVPFNHAYAKEWVTWLTSPDFKSNTPEGRKRPNGTGFLVSTLHFDQLTNVESVEVKEGATIEAETPVTLASLKVDGTSAGTLGNFAFAEQGTIDVTHASSGTVLPIVFSDCTDLANLANWKVTRDGTSTPARSIVVDNNRISVRNNAFILVVR